MEMKIYERSLQALLSSAPRSRVLARLASLAQIGELARRLDHSRPQSLSFLGHVISCLILGGVTNEAEWLWEREYEVFLVLAKTRRVLSKNRC